MRNSAPLLFAALLLACSGEDEPKGAGDGTSAAGKAGAAGTGSLVVGGSAGRAGEAGSAGAGGKAGGGQGGAAGFTVDLQPSKSVCGNGKLEPGERCDGTEGTTSDITCADLLGDPAATGTPTCDRCFPSHLGCVSCLDGRKNGAETDIDCGGTSGCTPCSLGKSCAADADCAATLGCYGGVCNDVSVSVLGSGVSEVAVGVGRAIPLSVRSSLPLPPGTTATIDAGANVSLESTSPLDVTRLVVRIPPGAAIKGTVTLGGHPFELALTPPNSAGGVSKLQSTAFSGRLCDTGAPLVLETVPSGPTPGMEVPVGRNVCFRVDLTDFVQYPWNASLGGTVLFSGPPLSQKHIDLSYPLPAVYPLWDARTGNTTVDLAIRFGTGAVSSLLVPQRLVLSPKTYRKGATGVGTTSSPADITLTTTALGGPYVSRTIIQLSGAHEIPAAGLIVPDNLVLVGIDDDASLVANKTGATVTLGNNSELRRLSVVGSAPAGTMPESPCIAVTGKGAALRGVAVRGCATGIQLKKDATAVMFGSGANDIQDVRDAIVGDGGATFTGATLGLSTSASKGPLTGVRGFEGGNVSLLRPKIEGFDVGVLLGDGATGELFDAVVASKGSAVQARTNAKLALVGGRLGASGTLSIGLAAETGALVDARGIAIEDASSGGVAVSGGTVNLTASVLRRCGGANTSAMFAAQGGSLRANGLRIEQPGQVGIFALKDAKSVSLTGTVVEATTFRSVWIFGGKATLRTVQLIDPVTTGLAYGDPAEPIDVRDLDIVRHFPCTDGSELVFADRKPGGVAERLSFHALVAGAGKVVSSVPDGPVCGRQLFDPNGGWYLRTNGDQQQVCF